jgi:hypothetical protein
MTTQRKKQGRGPGLRPDVWKSGPDETAHNQYTAWMRHRAQAHFRNEAHEITYDEWVKIWNQDDAWSQRGRGIDNICLCMVDSELGWTTLNVEIISRREQLKRSGNLGLGVPKKPRRTVIRADL